MRLYTIITLLFLVFALVSCKQTNSNFQKEAQNPELVHKSVKKITDIIVYDIFPPMIASRIYAYSTIAGYEALRPGNLQYSSLAGQIKGFTLPPQPETGKEYCYPLASSQAMMMVGKKFTFSDEEMEKYITQIHADYKQLNMPEEVYERSIKYGEAVAAHVLAWADKDNYKQSRTFPKYTINPDPATWKPTPPMYADAIEPHWNKIRPLTLDSAAQFKPVPPIKFSTDKNSAFYKAAYEVYTIGKTNQAVTDSSAWFWDDNALAMQVEGHFNFTTKKISPGGHWLNITNIAAHKANFNMMQSMEAYTMVAIGLFDGFISCWDEKYRSCLIRPETYITQYIDKNWVPVLQTPPFPEYTSGHSVVSGASSMILTNLLGDNFSFTDSTEVYCKQAPRTFSSFNEAAKQASISRLYGGIHYRAGIEVGLEQGQAIGKYVLQKVVTKKK